MGIGLHLQSKLQGVHRSGSTPVQDRRRPFRAYTEGHQSGDSIDWDGRISRLGDGEVRTALYEAASSLLVRAKASSGLKSWGLRIAKRAGHKKAVVAVARKLAVILHAMWVKDTEFRAKAAKMA